MIPFRVVVTYMNGDGKSNQQTYNFEGIEGALNRLAIEKAKSHTRSVEITTSILLWTRRDGTGRRIPI